LVVIGAVYKPVLVMPSNVLAVAMARVAANKVYFISI